MELGMIGLGKMGAFMTERLVRGGHRVVGFDRDSAAVKRVVDKGRGGDRFARENDRATESAARHLADGPVRRAGRPDHRSADAAYGARETRSSMAGIRTTRTHCGARPALVQKKMNFVDCGTSGGVWGLTEGYSMMVGGDADVVKRLAPIFRRLLPGRTKAGGAWARRARATS